MAITSNLESRGLKVVGGTIFIIEQSAIIKEQTTEKEVKWLALEQDITLAELLQETIESYLTRSY